MHRVSAKNERREASRLYKKRETRCIASLQKTRDAKHRVSTMSYTARGHNLKMTCHRDEGYHFLQ